MSIHVDVFLADPIITDLNLPPFERERMRCVYRLELPHCGSDPEILEETFRILNIDHPSDYNERSLSVGDVVTIGRRRSYRCDWLGWQRLERPLVQRRNLRDFMEWFVAHKQQLWPRIGASSVICADVPQPKLRLACAAIRSSTILSLSRQGDGSPRLAIRRALSGASVSIVVKSAVVTSGSLQRSAAPRTVSTSGFRSEFAVRFSLVEVFRG